MEFRFPNRWMINRPHTIVNNLRYPFRWLKFFIQRGNRGYSDADLWGFHYYLSDIISKGCHRLADIAIGYPGYGEANTLEKWEAILREIAEGFDASLNWEDDFYADKPDLVMHVSDEGHVTFDPHDWTYDELHVADKAHKVKLDKSMNLFKKWFYHLWD